MAMKSEKYSGVVIQFKKKYRFISNDFPSSPYVIAIIDGEEISRGFNKKEALINAKYYIKTRYNPEDIPIGVAKVS